jgi:hypothetical protein
MMTKMREPEHVAPTRAASVARQIKRHLPHFAKPVLGAVRRQVFVGDDLAFKISRLNVRRQRRQRQIDDLDASRKRTILAFRRRRR